jgi:hypothetical protein
MLYQETKMTPLNKISTKDKKAIDFAISQAQESVFSSSKRLGAVLKVKGQCILRREST